MLRRRRVTITVALGLLAIITIAVVWGCSAQATGDRLEQEPMSAVTPSFDVNSPDSVTVVVNKMRPLQPLDWTPTDLVLPEAIPNNWGDALRAEAATALQEMYQAADTVGLAFTITSGFRDYGRQAALFDGYVESDGIAAAESYSARPGHSEHQTGLAVDLTDGGECSLEECFGETELGQWLRAHAWEFGYILRYEQGQQATVGFSYEPWHFRYVGRDVSTAMHEQGIANLEDFVGLPAAPDYS